MDILNIPGLTESQIITKCHALTTIPSIIILLISQFILTLLFGFIIVKENRGKLFLIAIVSLIFSFGIALFLMFSPNSVYSLSEFFSKLFS